MKSLIKYILEEYDTFRCKDVEIHYNILYNNDNKIFFEVPITYSEDDFQIYLQDLYMDKLPGNTTNTNDLIGNNSAQLFDTLFEYERYEKSKDTPKEYVDWENSYDNHINKETDEFGYIKITKLQYIMKFDYFDIKDESSSNIDETIKKIFMSMNIVNDDNLPFDLVLDEKNIIYT